MAILLPKISKLSRKMMGFRVWYIFLSAIAVQGTLAEFKSIGLKNKDECEFGRPAINYDKEVFTFLVTSDQNTWSKLPLNKVTTLVLFMDPNHDLICYAHQNNIKVVTTVDFSGKILSNYTDRMKIVDETLQRALKYNMDGVNVDFEEAINKGDPNRSYLTLMIDELSQAFHHHIPQSQVTVDLPYDPDGTYGRWFDAFGIAYASDFIIAMDYDLENFRIASANSGYDDVLKGAQRYLDMGIPPSKLVLAMPWYGYKLDCSVITKNHTCVVKNKGIEINYSEIAEKYLNTYRTSDVLWDPIGLSPYFDMKINGTLAQMRYDNSTSLKLKYDIAIKLNLLGVGMWTANSIDYGDSIEAFRQRADMWGAIPFMK